MQEVCGVWTGLREARCEGRLRGVRVRALWKAEGVEAVGEWWWQAEEKPVRDECGCGGGPAPVSRPKVRAWLGIPRRWKHGDERVKRWRGSMRPAPNGNGPTWMTLRRSWSRWASPPKPMSGSLSAWRSSASMCDRRRTGDAPTAERKRLWPSRGCSSGAKRSRRSQSWQG